jgi:hypothetical protein
MVDYGFVGGFREIVLQMSQYGVFDILMPFVFVFALVFAILEKINVFQNKGVNLVLSMVIAFFTISNAYISSFFMYLFANLALGVAILLVLVILLGFALKEEEDKDIWKWIFGIAGGALFLVVIGRSGLLNVLFGANIYYIIQQNAPLIIILLIVGLMIFAIYNSSKKGNKDEEMVLKKKHG